MGLLATESMTLRLDRDMEAAGGWVGGQGRAGQGGVKMEMEAEGPTGLRGWRRETACISAMMRCGCHQM